ncbi:MAG TPA: glycosyltransferase, partial [Candidatus Eisenbacteria bacterium]
MIAAFAALADSLRGAALALYALAQLLLGLYSGHRYLTLLRVGRRARGGAGRGTGKGGPPARWPIVTVQLPIYNERRVAGRLIDAVAALDYPAGRLEIQVLDDSTDETREGLAAAVERHRARGVDIRILHRDVRAGYKAGALAAGLARARGEWIAVFDADFVPPPGFLRRAARHFSDPRVGMVQARWGHLNRDRSLVTAAQAVLLDAHFLLEQEARMRSGLFFNFNGTAGVWRRACIEDAGGWRHDTLTEDLDLSYRAQLRGWRFVFDAGNVAPAELPADLEAFKSQQRRWAKGSIQTARKLLPAILASPLPARVKLEALIHLTSNACYPLLLVLALLLPPVLLGAARVRPAVVWGLQAGVLAFGLLPVVLFLVAGQRLAGRRGPRVARDVAAAIVVGSGLSLNNARAVIEGLGRRVGDWQRTPKTGEGAAAAGLPEYRASSTLAGRAELALAAYSAGLGGAAWGAGEGRAIPFLAVLAAGFAIVGAGSMRSALASRRLAGVPARPPG